MDAIKGKEFPKAELHCHLEGSFRVSTIIELAKERHVKLPYFDEKNIREKILVTKRCENLREYLSSFYYTTIAYAGSTEAISRITREAIEDKARGGVRYLELRFGPQLHASCGVDPLLHCQPGNVTTRDIVEAVCDSAKQAGRDFNVVVGIILCCLAEIPQWSNEIAELCMEYRGRGVVGMDIAGASDKEGEAFHQHFKAFDFCKENNIPRTVHAGENGSSNEVHNAITKLHAQRIGHGYHLVDDEQVLNQVRTNSIHVEACPLSSYYTASVDPDLTKHPAIKFMREGIKFSINSDDPGIHQASLLEDYKVAIDKFGFTIKDLKQLNMNALDAAFIDEETRAKLKAEFKQAYELISD